MMCWAAQKHKKEREGSWSLTMNLFIQRSVSKDFFRFVEFLHISFQGSRVSKVSKGLCMTPKLQNPLLAPVVWIQRALPCFVMPCCREAISWLGLILLRKEASFADVASISSCSKVKVEEIQNGKWLYESNALQGRLVWPSSWASAFAVWTFLQTPKTLLLWFSSQKWNCCEITLTLEPRTYLLAQLSSHFCHLETVSLSKIQTFYNITLRFGLSAPSPAAIGLMIKFIHDMI